MYNPRFPHSLHILRQAVDEVTGEPTFDESGNPVYAYVTVQLVKTLDGDPCFNADGSFQTEDADVVSFGYRTNTMNIRQAGEVVAADYKIACPMFLGELKYDDVLEITDFDRTYRGRVVKKVTFNWGTNIWFDEIMN